MSRNPRKRTRIETRHETLPLGDDEDFYVITACEVQVRPGGQSYTVPVSPEKRKTNWSSRDAWLPEDPKYYGLDPTSVLCDVAMNSDGVYCKPPAIKTPVVLAKTGKRRKTLRALRPHQHWRNNEQQAFLEELICYDGRGDWCEQPVCCNCRLRGLETPGVYWCLECFGGVLFCRDCCVQRHHLQPLHVIEEWREGLFQHTTLKRLGLSIQLQHLTTPCPSPAFCHKNFRILHWNGVHEVDLRFCGCHKRIPQQLQLLRRRLYPATTIHGQITTVATFGYLEQLHHLVLTTKCSAYDICRALVHASDTTGLKEVAWRYRALIRMQLQWQHLKLLKQCGQGHNLSGVAGTQEGDLMISCPSCAHPGINLPENWQQDSEKSWLYFLRLAMDTNFCLKRATGLIAFAGPWVALQQLQFAKVLTKFSRGLQYTGVGAVGCARGEMFIKNGVGNLQKGEWYGNMDYVFASVLAHFVGLLTFIIGYDITCQWFVHLFERMMTHWPDHLKPKTEWTGIPVIGKFHEPAHNTSNHKQFSCNLAKWVGLSDFETMECLWGLHNILGNLVKTMGPGTYRDMLEAHFGFHNWEKY
ncbi:hypothetical protein BT96DRAFT_986280 [Gymnopus androsaceus JB14]|uniref:CxC2-like cysteine cluster KDZ transposase-associated domain-containing protein n=1 Tax=Gymnopus androsaceus JB14 TaxID=1447944 RepID=A0A6A4IG52_9AGAR|nr:hypothetical protein BT96DRAFT_986280 [Gymnopus androsaceus JB14]